jgi:hypothetical protein
MGKLYHYVEDDTICCTVWIGNLALASLTNRITQMEDISEQGPVENMWK